MAKLVFKISDSEELDYPLNAALIRLGRDASNNIVIDNSWISSFHATFYRSMDGRLQVEDLNSSNGTFVNGQRILAIKTLKFHDIVTFGQLDAVIEPSAENDTNELQSGLPPVVDHETTRVALRAPVAPGASGIGQPFPPGTEQPKIRPGISVAPMTPRVTAPQPLNEPPAESAVAALAQTSEPPATLAMALDVDRLKAELKESQKAKEGLLKEIRQLEETRQGLQNTEQDMRSAAMQARELVAGLVKEKDGLEQDLLQAHERSTKQAAEELAARAKKSELESAMQAAERDWQRVQAETAAAKEALEVLAQQKAREAAALDDIKKQAEDEMALTATHSKLLVELTDTRTQRDATERELASLREALAQEAARLKDLQALAQQESAAVAKLTATESAAKDLEVRAEGARLEISELEKSLAELMKRTEAEQRRQREVISTAREELRVVHEQVKDAKTLKEELHALQAETLANRNTQREETARFLREKDQAAKIVDDLLAQRDLLRQELAASEFALREQQFAEVEKLKVQALGMLESIRTHESSLGTSRRALEELQTSLQNTEQSRTQAKMQLEQSRDEHAAVVEQLATTRQQIRDATSSLDATNKAREIAEQEQRLLGSQLEQIRKDLEFRRKELQEAELLHQEARLAVGRLTAQADQSHRLVQSNTEEASRQREEATAQETKARSLKQEINQLQDQKAAELRAKELAEKEHVEATGAVAMVQGKLQETRAQYAQAEEQLNQASQKLAEKTAELDKSTAALRSEHLKLTEEIEIMGSKKTQLTTELAGLSADGVRLKAEGQQLMAAQTEANSSLERLRFEISQQATTKQGLSTELELLANQSTNLKSNQKLLMDEIVAVQQAKAAAEHARLAALTTREQALAEAASARAEMEGFTVQITQMTASLATLEKDRQRADFDRGAWDQIRSALGPLREEQKTLEQEIHVLRRERSALLEEATKNVRESLATLEGERASLEKHIKEMEERLQTLTTAFTPEWGTVQALAKNCIKELDLLDDMERGLVARKADAGVLEQIRLFRSSFLTSLAEFSVIPYQYEPDTVLDVKTRKRISILETQRGGTGPSKILETVRPGYECNFKGEQPALVLRKCEVVIQTEG